jgi:hypothetical protein
MNKSAGPTFAMNFPIMNARAIMHEQRDGGPPMSKHADVFSRKSFESSV